MPSNAMKLSQHIAECQRTMEAHGDVDCVLVTRDAIIALDGRNMNVVGEVLGHRLPQPVLSFGMWRDAEGRVQNNPGALYQATADDGGWNYVREDAPEDVDLAVWRRGAGRHGGRDVGWRVGAKWYVLEGASERPARPIEIVPEAILAWRPL